MERQRVSSASPWEPVVGYSRALRVGNQVFVAGTTGTDPAGNVAGKDAHTQTVAALEKIEDALRQAGASITDVVRTRMYVTNVDDWQEVGRAHAEFFSDVRPATTLVEVSRLVNPEMLVEIEADAVVDPDRSAHGHQG